MSTLETQTQPKPSGKPSADSAASGNALASAEQAARPAAQFSPDPLRPTDRYRLVTPYRLGQDD